MQGVPIFGRQVFPVGPLPRHGICRPLPEARGNGIERIVEVRPAWRLIDARRRAEGPRFAFPPAHWHLRLLNLFPRHALKVIIAGVEFPHMIKAEPLPVTRPIAARAAPTGGRRTKFAQFRAAGCSTGLTVAKDPTMKTIARTGIPIAHSHRHSLTIVTRITSPCRQSC